MKLHSSMSPTLLAKGNTQLQARKANVSLYKTDRVSFGIGFNKGLFSALDQNDHNGVVLAFERGAGANAPTPNGHYPMHLLNSVKIAQTLINHGGELEVKSPSGNTPLLMAKNIKITDFLVRHGADIYAVNNHGSNALHLAKSAKQAEFFINKGLNVNSVDKLGNTPLHIHAKNKKIRNLLLRRGANPDLLNNRGEVAYKKVENLFMKLIKAIF